jgi:hypothetical protein
MEGKERSDVKVAPIYNLFEKIRMLYLWAPGESAVAPTSETARVPEFSSRPTPSPYLACRREKSRHLKTCAALHKLLAEMC